MMRLTIEELLSAVVETTKVVLAIEIARLLTDTLDEAGNDLTDDQIQAEVEMYFFEVVDEYDNTLKQVLARMMETKRIAVLGVEEE